MVGLFIRQRLSWVCNQYAQKGGEKQDKYNYPSVSVETGNIDFQTCSCYNYIDFYLSFFFVTGLILAIERRHYTAKNPFCYNLSNLFLQFSTRLSRRMR